MTEWREVERPNPPTRRNWKGKLMRKEKEKGKR